MRVSGLWRPEIGNKLRPGQKTPAVFFRLGVKRPLFTSAANESESVELGTAEEGVYQNSRWVPGRRLNGNEAPGWRALRLRSDNYSIQHVKLCRCR